MAKFRCYKGELVGIIMSMNDPISDMITKLEMDKCQKIKVGMLKQH